MKIAKLFTLLVLLLTGFNTVLGQSNEGSISEPIVQICSAAIGSIRLGSLFLGLLTRTLTGYATMRPSG